MAVGSAERVSLRSARGLARARTAAVRIFWRSGDHRILGLAAETAFFAVLSIFPGLLLLAAALGSLGSIVGSDLADTVERNVLRFLNLILTNQASGVIESISALFEPRHGRVITLATIGALVTLSGAFGATVSALNVIYGTKETRSWLFRRLVGLALAAGSIVIGACILAVAVVGPLLGREEVLRRITGTGTWYQILGTWLRWPLLFVALVVWATTLCHYGPSQRCGWRRDLPGGTIAASLWLVASVGFNVYLRMVRDSPIFGALGGGLILMTWLYLLSLGLLIGAEINAYLQQHVRRRSGHLFVYDVDDEPTQRAGA